MVEDPKKITLTAEITVSRIVFWWLRGIVKGGLLLGGAFALVGVIDWVLGAEGFLKTILSHAAFGVRLGIFIGPIIVISKGCKFDGFRGAMFRTLIGALQGVLLLIILFPGRIVLEVDTDAKAIILGGILGLAATDFIIRRVLITIPTILVVITLTWGLIILAPGNFYTSEKRVAKEIEKNIRVKYGLDQPLYLQYGRMMRRTVKLDFGDSLTYRGQSVNAIIARSLPVSAAVGILAYLLALLVGITIGSIAALKQNSRWDYASMTLAMLGISIPNFVLGPLLVLIFSLSLYWLPPARWGGFFSKSLILPVLTLSAIYMAYIARLTRAGMLEVLRSDYIRTARAKGLRERDVVIRHALRGGLMPVVSFTGPALAFLLTGTVVVEKIFALPGLGNYLIQASLNRDKPLILGIVAFIAMTLLLMNLLVDIAYAYLDPRIRY